MDKEEVGGTWVAQLVKHLSLDLSSGLDLRGHEFKPHDGPHDGCGAYFLKKRSHTHTHTCTHTLLIMLV